MPQLPLLSHRQSRSGRRQKPRRGRSIVVLLVLLLLWSVCLGLGLAQAATRPATAIAQVPGPTQVPGPAQAAIGTVDPVTEGDKVGQDLYLQNCATCHVGLPPAIMPSETWRQLLQESEHYGATLAINRLDKQIIWQYLRKFSRPHAADEAVPFRIYQSRYFTALHPRVELPTKAGLGSCISCHPGAGQYDFRSLSAEWQNAP